jgi:hypothetical protein
VQFIPIGSKREEERQSEPSKSPETSGWTSPVIAAKSRRPVVPTARSLKALKASEGNTNPHPRHRTSLDPLAGVPASYPAPKHPSTDSQLHRRETFGSDFHSKGNIFFATRIGSSIFRGNSSRPPRKGKTCRLDRPFCLISCFGLVIREQPRCHPPRPTRLGRQRKLKISDFCLAQQLLFRVVALSPSPR